MSMFDLDDDEDEVAVNLSPGKNRIGEEEDKASKGLDDFSDDESFAETISSLPPDAQQNEKLEEAEITEEQRAAIKAAERERSERNRLKAINLKKARLMTRPTSKSGGGQLAAAKQPKLVDSGGGFFIEEDDGQNSKPVIVEEPGPIISKYDQPNCEMCDQKFSNSYLLSVFDHVVCDKCKDCSKDGEHELIAKTEAKSTFLLKDFDLEKSEHGPALKFKTRKNPHRAGGEMKLYLRLQVEKRAIQVWGSEEALTEEIEAREEKKVEMKARKYNRKMKALRMAVRSSLYKKDLSTHVHEFENEIYDEDKDEYSQTCKTCGYINTYEKL